MSILPQLIPIQLGVEKKQQIVLTNIVKMLTNRGLLNSSEMDKNIKILNRGAHFFVKFLQLSELFQILLI